MTKPLPNEFTFIIEQLLQAFPDALSIYAFGSRMHGTARADSDLDLAVLAKGYADPLMLWEVANQLASHLGYDVDLLDLRAASTIMQHQVISTGEKIWGDSLDAQLFELFVLKEKHYFEERRAKQIEQIMQDGKVYGW